MKFVSPAQLSNLGKTAIGFILSLTALLQVPQVNSVIMPLIQHHPHLSTIFGGLVTVSALFANPQVQNFFGIERTVQTPQGTVKETTTISTPPASNM